MLRFLNRLWSILQLIIAVFILYPALVIICLFDTEDPPRC